MGAALSESLKTGGDRAAGHVPGDPSCCPTVGRAAHINVSFIPVSKAFIFWQNKESPCKNN